MTDYFRIGESYDPLSVYQEVCVVFASIFKFT
jgi:hypothetical protein